MITSQGAIYTTENGGLNWKAMVKETIDATLNRVSSSGTSGASFFSGKIINQVRDVNGNYLAIASRGNLFLTWSPVKIIGFRTTVVAPGESRIWVLLETTPRMGYG